MSVRKRDESGGDRRQATIMFADISGFTAMSRSMDPEDVKETIDDCFRIIEKLITDRGGTIDKYIGDCVMALFGAPVAIEHAPQQAINAAIAIRDATQAYDRKRNLPAPLNVHIGVNTGLVAAGTVGGDDRRDYTVMGESVNLAARLQGAATDGQIIVGRTTYKAASREFEFRKLSLDLKGYDGAVEAFELVTDEERKYRARPGIDAVDARSSLVGRRQELALLSERMENLSRGAGSIVSVVGENGLGKSRLWAEARALPITAEFEFVEARCLAVGGGLAFHCFIDFLRNWTGLAEGADTASAFAALEPRVAALRLEDSEQFLAVAARLCGLDGPEYRAAVLDGLEGEALERVIHSAFGDLLRAISKNRPLLLVVEDLHWADRASLRLLEALLPIVRDAQLMVCVLCRPQYPETTEYLLAHLENRYAGLHTNIRLRPLTTAAIAELTKNLAGSKSLPGSAHRLIEDRTEGNPFYIEEVVRTLTEQLDASSDSATATSVDLPSTIEGVILTRVDRLTPEVKDVLQVASVVGRKFDRDVVEALLGNEIDVDGPLAELVDKELLTQTVSRSTASARVRRLRSAQIFTFKHALIQEAVYGSLLKKERREVHAACAGLIEREFADRFEDSYGMLAYHYLRAEMLEKAEEFTFKAGELAARTAASHDALDHFREAYRLYHLIRGGEADTDKRRALELNLAQALFNTGNLAESIEHFDAALELLGEWVPKRTSTLWMKFAKDMSGLLLRLYAGRNRRGKRDDADSHAVVQILYNRARAENITDPARYIFDTIAAPRYLQKVDTAKCDQACEVTATTGAFFAFGGVSIPIARKFLDESSHMLRPERPADEFSYRAMGTLVEFHAGDWSDRYDIDEELMQRGLRAGRLWTADVYCGMFAARSMRQGRFGEVETQLELLRRMQSDYGYEFAASTEHAEAAFLLVEQRRLEEAASAMRLYYEIRQEDALHVLALSGSAKISALSGDLDEADEYLTRCESIIATASLLPPYYTGAYATTRLLVDVLRLERSPGDSRLAKRAARSAKKARSLSASIARERVETFRLSARVAAAAGRRKEARRFFGAAIDEAESLEARPELARSFVDVSHFLDRGDSGEAFREKTVADFRREAFAILMEIGNVAEAAALQPGGGSAAAASHGYKAWAS
jgi:class 3 adenylate cyclase/tetratricopeptide (TPR) repeat protein